MKRFSQFYCHCLWWRKFPHPLFVQSDSRQMFIILQIILMSQRDVGETVTVTFRLTPGNTQRHHFHRSHEWLVKLCTAKEEDAAGGGGEEEVKRRWRGGEEERDRNRVNRRTFSDGDAPVLCQSLFLCWSVSPVGTEAWNKLSFYNTTKNIKQAQTKQLVSCVRLFIVFRQKHVWKNQPKLTWNDWSSSVVTPDQMLTHILVCLGPSISMSDSRY